MTSETEMPAPAPRPAAKRRRDGPLARRRGDPSAGRWCQSPLVKRMLVSLITNALWLIRRTNRWSRAIAMRRSPPMPKYTPTIVALWHGQHLLTPFYYPRGEPLVVMVSRSADAEMNALVIEKIGFEAVRGSGGREQYEASGEGWRPRA